MRLPLLSRSLAVGFMLILVRSIATAQLTADFNQFFEQDQEEIEGGAEGGNQFGAALAAGDFNGDGFQDLAVGMPGEDGGSVIVINGTADRLSREPFPEGNKRWRQGQDCLPDDPENEDSFGFSVAAGDFNGDGFDDLAVGAPGENRLRGAVFVINGSQNGLTCAGSKRWRQGSDDIRDDDDPGDFGGWAVVAGDFNGDGFDDLVFGVPGEGGNEGVVNVIYGSNGGLTSNGNQRWRQGGDRDGELIGGRENGDGFGSELAAGDFDGDGFDDLAVGVPGENSGKGAVNVIYGSRNRLTDIGNQRWSQEQDDIMGGAEDGNGFGSALSVADFNADGFGDLAVGLPGEDGGSVIVIYGSSNRLTSQGNQRWRQGDNGIFDEAEGGNAFGAELAGGDFDGDGFADLAVGVPREDDSQGAVHAIYGSPEALISEGNQFFKQDISQPEGSRSEDGDGFSSALAAGDFNDDGADDLAIGVPGENGGRGAVNVVYGSIPFAITNGASFALGAVAPEAIVSMFGEDLASETAVAATIPLPTTLAGTIIEITDSNGVTRPSPLFFASEGQINFLIPEGTVPGAATVRVLRNGRSTLTGSLQVENVAPGLFTADASGAGAPAAFYLRVAGDGAQTQELAFDTGTLAPVPIDLGPPGDQIFLLLFGTGIRGSTAGVTASVDGLNVPVLGAVPQGEFVGLDQVNIGPLPRVLGGSGNVEVLLTVDGIETNVVTVSIQ